MALSYPLTGWAANDPTPATNVEVAFAQGQASAGTGTYAVLLIGNFLSAGSATAGTLYGPDTAVPMVSLTDAANLFGTGSALYRMVKRSLSVSNQVSLYAVPVAESSGVKATGVVTFATTAAANGVARFHLGDEYVDAQITSGDSVTTIATAVRDAINAKLEWPVTATISSGVLTVTARQKGLHGNWITFGCQIIGTGVATTSSQGPMAFMSGGTTADDYTTALATILPRRFYYIVSEDDGSQSSTNLTAVCTQVTAQALPTTGIRQVVIAGANDTSASAITSIAAALQNARAQVYHHLGGDMPPGEIAATMATAEAAYEAGHGSSTLSFNGFGQAVGAGYWRFTPSKRGSVFTATQIKSALNGGVSPITQTSNGRTYLVARITTKSQTSSVADYRIRPAHKVRVCDWFGDDVQSLVTLEFAGKTIAADPVAPNKPPPGAVYPQLFENLLKRLVTTYDNSGLLQNADAIRSELDAVREVTPSTRLSAYVPLQPIDLDDQNGIFIAQVA